MTRFSHWMSAAAGHGVLWPLILLLAAGLSAACGNDTVSDESSEGLRDLTKIEELRRIFNRDTGAARLILLLSPT
ncbi:MAG: hypothetical protein OXR72_15720 [Gemmatimonadota bacterium]|nr:hypothetical protein [Gemmatimonadota bacterium]